MGDDAGVIAMTVGKPQMPMRLFDDAPSAVAWLRTSQE